MNLFTKQKQKTKLWLPKGKGEGRMINQKYENNTYIPLYVKQTTRIHCIICGTVFNILITYNEKESEAIHLKLTQYGKSTVV